MALESEPVTVPCGGFEVFALDVFIWWEQAGRFFYADDEGLRHLVKDATKAVGWRRARRALRAQETSQ